MSDSFSDWTAKVAEAWCVLQGIEVKRRFTNDELREPMEQVRREMSYAGVMTYRDRLARHEGRADHDLDVCGRQLKAGS